MIEKFLFLWVSLLLLINKESASQLVNLNRYILSSGQRSSSLHYAACFGRPGIGKVLLRHGANPDLRLVIFFLRHGANPDLRLVIIFLLHGANPDIRFVMIFLLQGAIHGLRLVMILFWHWANPDLRLVTIFLRHGASKV